MKKRMGRPKEPKRKHLHIMILPATDEAIRGAVVKGDKSSNTAGKVVDKLAGGKR